jgi:hypothetical protein
MTAVRTKLYPALEGGHATLHGELVGGSLARRTGAPGPPLSLPGDDRQISRVSIIALRWSGRLTDAVGLLLLAWSIPFAVLLVGIPIALAIVLLLWVGRLALGAF